MLGFVHANPGSIAIDKGEATDEGRAKLAAFIKKVMGRPIKRFDSVGELAAVVGASVAREKNRRPGVGWVRGNLAMTPETEAEISNLRAQVAELELSRVQTEASSESLLSSDELQQLASGSDVTTLTAGFGRHYSNGHVGSWFFETEIEMSWDSIFIVVGPALISEGSDQAIKDRVENAIGAFVTAKSLWPKSEFQVGVETDEETLDRIKVQLRALNLIDRGTKRRTVSDKQTYWKLTERGDLYLAQLMAARRPSASS